jgi:hypothetical protein
VFFTHNFSGARGFPARGKFVPSLGTFRRTGKLPAPPIKKPRLMTRRGGKTFLARLLIFPGPMMPGLELAPVIET